MSDESPDSDVIILDLSSEEINEAFANAPLYLKKAIVKARTATPGQQVKTILANGTEETVNSAQEGDIIVTNPGGEEYILKFEKFSARYEALDDQGTFRAKGVIRAITNPIGKSISVKAPWGEEQFGDAECIVAATYDPLRPDEVSTDRYIIGKEEFLATYKLTDKNPDSDPNKLGGLTTPSQVADELLAEMPQ